VPVGVFAVVLVPVPDDDHLHDRDEAMSQICYVAKRFYAAKATLLPFVQEVITEYAQAGFRLNSRSVAYRLEGRGVITKTDTNFQQIENIVSDGRDMGLIDWNDIAGDGARGLHELTTWPNASALLVGAAEQYRLDKWANQSGRLEIITEKAGLHGVLDSVADAYEVPVRALKGYDGKGDARATAVRIMRRTVAGSLLHFVHVITGDGTVRFNDEFTIDDATELVVNRWGAAAADEIVDGGDQLTSILFVGDHDPSGLDLERDVRHKLDFYGASGLYTIERVAITCAETCRAAVTELHSNPAKEKDSRWPAYVAGGHTDQAWEVEALEPSVLADRVREAIERHIDADQWDTDLDAEKSDLGRLSDLADDWDDDEADE
jgi:hypothetical protein